MFVYVAMWAYVQVPMGTYSWTFTGSCRLHGWVWGTKLGSSARAVRVSDERMSVRRTDLWVLATNIISQVAHLIPAGRSL